MSHHDTIRSIYDTHVAPLPEGERLRLAELITRELAVSAAATATGGTVRDPLEPVVGWRHPAERRGDLTEWSDRSL